MSNELWETISEILKWVLILSVWLLPSLLKRKKGEKARPGKKPRRARMAPRVARPVFGAHPILEPLREEVEAFLGEMEGQEGVGDLIPQVRQGYLEPLQKLSRGLPPRREVVEAYQVYWTLLKGSLEQRLPGGLPAAEGEILRDLDALAEEVRRDLVQGLGVGPAFPVRRLLPVMVEGDSRLASHSLRATAATGIALVGIHETAGSEVWQWAEMYREMGRLLWHHLPGLDRAIARRSLASAKPLSLIALNLVPQQHITRHLISVWLPEIFTDVLAARALGPAALEGAWPLYRGMRREHLGLIAGEETMGGGFAYSPQPPPHLRMAVMARVIAQGPFGGEAEEGWSRWVQEHGTPEELILELPGTFGRPLPAEPFLEEVERATDEILGLRIHPFGGRRLPDIPALGIPYEEHEIALRAARNLETHRMARLETARGVIAFAALAFREHGVRAAPEARRVLAHHLRGEPLVDEISRPEAAEPVGVAAEGTLGELLREGIVWREILQRPVSRRIR